MPDSEGFKASIGIIERKDLAEIIAIVGAVVEL